MTHLATPFYENLEAISKNPYLLRKFVTMCISNGICMFPSKQTNHRNPVLAPVSVTPSMTFSNKLYQMAVRGSLLSAQLIERIVMDKNFLNRALKITGEVDEFTGRLLQMYNEIYLSGEKDLSQCVRANFLRTDWMRHSATPDAPNDSKDVVKQVEINTISVAFAGLASRLSDCHQKFISSISPLSPLSPLPANPVCDNLCRIFDDIEKHKFNIFDDTILSREHSQINLLYLVAAGDESNEMDQRIQEYAFLKKNINVIRIEFEELCRGLKHGRVALESANATHKKGGYLKLTLPSQIYHPAPHKDGAGSFWDTAIAATDESLWVHVIYYRAMYDPSHFVCENSWRVRDLFERSQAISLPSLPSHLAGSKKIQQILYQRESLRELGCSEEDSTFLLSVFCAQYDLFDRDEGTLGAIADAESSPHRYVLKPQREGGGNNLHGEEIVKYLREKEEREGREGREASPYILMRKIVSPTYLSVFFDASNPLISASLHPSMCELGIYTSALFIPGVHESVEIAFAGHLVRTKYSSSLEGGVAKGYAVLNSPCLYSAE